MIDKTLLFLMVFSGIGLLACLPLYADPQVSTTITSKDHEVLVTIVVQDERTPPPSTGELVDDDMAIWKTWGERVGLLVVGVAGMWGAPRVAKKIKASRENSE